MKKQVQKRVVIRRDRVTGVALVVLCMSDGRQLWVWINDPEINYFLNEQRHRSLAEVRAFIQSSNASTRDYVYGIVDRNDELIGVIGLHSVNRTNGTAATGAYIGRKDLWGKGYGTAAKRLQLNIAFRVMKLRKVTSSAYAFNDRSLAYFKKSGYTVEGVRKTQTVRNGVYCDEALLAIFAEDFLRQHT